VGDPGIVEKEDADSLFMEMICPSGTNPDDSPLYVLCCNDTCSFTWTGAEHINQVSPPPVGRGWRRRRRRRVVRNSRWAAFHPLSLSPVESPSTSLMNSTRALPFPVRV